MKKTLVVMMAFVLGLAITSCKQAPKAAEAAETTEAAAADPVQALTELVEKAKADGSIDNAKKHPKCPGCGAEVKPGQKFCSDCGTSLN